jgi:hypothetical protein
MVLEMETRYGELYKYRCQDRREKTKERQQLSRILSNCKIRSPTGSLSAHLPRGTFRVERNPVLPLEKKDT